MIDLMLISTFMLYAALGAVTRVLFGIYRAYTKSFMFGISWRMVCVEILASIFFGVFFSTILMEMKWTNFSISVAALIAGFLGPNLVDIITKRIGLTKAIEVRVNGERIYLADLNERQVKGMEFMKTHGRITNDVYQRLNPRISHWTASRDLNKLAKAKKIKKRGIGKGTYYIL